MILGCGGGGGSYLIGVTQHPEAHLTCMDLSSEMIRLTEEKCKPLTEAPFNRKIDFVEGSAESLPFEDGTFDAVLSNYCLHLVPNPDLVLKEVHRVLKKGGKACFSVWGRQEYSPQFTIIQKCVAECKKEWGIVDNKLPPRSPFHLNNKDETRERALKVGFDMVQAWYQFQPFHTTTAKEFTELNIETPDLMALLSNVSEEQAQYFKDKMEKMAGAIYDKNEPIGNDVLMLLAIK